MWIHSLLAELGVSFSCRPMIHYGVTYLSVNPIFHSCMKHISIDFHFVRDLVSKGHLQVAHISTTDQLADVLTNPDLRVPFSIFGLRSESLMEPPSCGGHISDS